MPERPLAGQLNRIVTSILRGGEPAPRDRNLAALAEIAGALRDLPSDEFRQRLKTDLQRRATLMTAAPTQPAVRAHFRTITPFLIHAQAPELVEFIQATFGAREVKRIPDAGRFYSELQIGESMLMIAGGAAASHGNLTSTLHVYVNDCDAVYRRALEAGAVTLNGAQGEPSDRPYGERLALVQDAFGNRWYMATRIGPPVEGFDSAIPYVHPKRARDYMEFLKQAFGAEVLGVAEQAGRVMNAAARIGDGVLEMGEPDASAELSPSGCFLFVEDVQAAYDRALAAGATAVRPPADEPFGLRSAIVRDPAGYFWWPARWLA